MSELTPLLSSTDDELEMLLLRSAEGDEPSANALPKVAAALGIGAATLGAATSAVLVEQALVGSAAAKPITLVSVLKWLGVGMTAGALAGGTAHVAFRPARTGALALSAVTAPTPVPAAQRELRPLAPSLIPPPPPDEDEDEEVTEEEAPPSPTNAAARAAARPDAPRAPAAAPPHGSTASFAADPPPAATPEQVSALSEEVRSLDAARRELTAGHAAAALAAIDNYRARFPQGSLRTEATVLRVEALLRSGDRAGAEREAHVIVRAAPGSRHAARVLDLLGR
jgi:hypothetical protein